MRWLRDETPFAAVLAVALCGVAVLAIWSNHWRPGACFIAGAMFLAALLRLVVPPPRIGVLAVRARWFDVAAYVSTGVVILGVAIRLH